MLSPGQIIAAKLWQSTTADAFSGFLGILMKNIEKPITLMLDNASIHKAKKDTAIDQASCQARINSLFFTIP
jgi:hypothetical protein